MELVALAPPTPPVGSFTPYSGYHIKNLAPKRMFVLYVYTFHIHFTDQDKDVFSFGNQVSSIVKTPHCILNIVI